MGGGSRLNRAAISFRTKVISMSGLMAENQPQFECVMSGNVGSAMSESGVCLKCGGSSWNHIDISFRSTVFASTTFYMSIFGL